VSNVSEQNNGPEELTNGCVFEDHYISDDCFTVTILQNRKAQIIQR
jgi:hypothetical protein